MARLVEIEEDLKTLIMQLNMLSKKSKINAEQRQNSADQASPEQVNGPEPIDRVEPLESPTPQSPERTDERAPIVDPIPAPVAKPPHPRSR